VLKRIAIKARRVLFGKRKKNYSRKNKMNYTNTQIEAMYLDWFNNFLSCDAWRQHYNLGMAEGENILDIGRQLNQIRKHD